MVPDVAFSAIIFSANEPFNATMTKSELIEQLAVVRRIPRIQAEEVVNSLLTAIADSLADGKRIEVRGTGSFSLKQHRSYVGRNPRTGEEVGVPAKHSIHFKVGKELREAVEALIDKKEDAEAAAE